MATKDPVCDSEIAFERGLSRDRAPREVIRLVYDEPIPKTNRRIRCCDLFGSRRVFDKRWKDLEEAGCRMLLCHRYVLEVEN